MYWISWRKLPELFSERRHGRLKRDILSDLVAVIKSLGLTFFEGIKIPEPIEITWKFQTNEFWNWVALKQVEINWAYADRKL